MLGVTFCTFSTVVSYKRDLRLFSVATTTPFEAKT